MAESFERMHLDVEHSEATWKFTWKVTTSGGASEGHEGRELNSNMSHLFVVDNFFVQFLEALELDLVLAMCGAAWLEYSKPFGAKRFEEEMRWIIRKVEELKRNLDQMPSDSANSANLYQQVLNSLETFCRTVQDHPECLGRIPFLASYRFMRIFLLERFRFN
ncbi:unnamed protein product [Caenorhabditis sp. 36 PRJEB53466]|nr:unnamed protein product [Caenorhabditis sp. 36 PRJEB53466]